MVFIDPVNIMHTFMKKVIISILSALTGMAAGMIITGKAFKAEAARERAMSEKYLDLFLMMNQWVQAKQEGKSLAEYLLRKNYRTIAVYGMGHAGERLVEELKNGEVRIRYGIDKNAEGVYADVDVLTPEDDLEEVDAVIVTSISFINEIEKNLSARLSCPVISLEDILYEL